MNKENLKNEMLAITDWRHPFEVEPGVWVTLFRDWFKEWHLWRVDTLMPTIETIAAHVLPGGIKGAKVLDTGCWDGFYGFEFLKRGAGHLKGVDLREEAIRRANLVKDYYGYKNCDFEVKNVQDIDRRSEQFDITLMYGILYHLSAPIDVIKRLGDMTRSMLLLSTYASPGPEPVLTLKRENPDKDSTGFQELITTPSQGALIEMLNFAGFDLVLRDYPYPFYERYRGSDFGFFYAVKTSNMEKGKSDALLKQLKVRDAYDPKLKQHQVVRLTRPEPRALGLKKRIGLKLHGLIDKVF
ncbi:MAG: methyltransferase domain-containing protein [bacterium]|nr:methyltransferase domain-containing protein [bacterium]